MLTLAFSKNARRFTNKTRCLVPNFGSDRAASVCSKNDIAVRNNYSVEAVLIISVKLVIPAKALSRPSSNMVVIPSRIAIFFISSAVALLTVASRIGREVCSISYIPVRP